MYTLLNLKSENELKEQKILENFDNEISKNKMINSNNENINTMNDLSQVNISRINTNDENIEKTKENQNNYKPENTIKLENRVIKRELINEVSYYKNIKKDTILNEGVIIKNSYELACDLLNTIKHINEAEYLLKKHNKLLNKAMQDILHKIESDKFNVVEGYKLAKKIQMIRNEKNLIRENLAIYKQLNSLDIINKDIICKLDDIINNVESDTNITYEPKILKDLNFRYDNEKIYSRYDDIKKENFINLGIEEF